MLQLLARLREHYGSLRGYTDALGLSDVQVDRLRDRLLEARTP